MIADDFMASLGLPEVYRVGGSVRDGLLGRSTKDHDYLVRGASIERIAESIHATGSATARSLTLRDGRAVGVRTHLPGAGVIDITLPRKEISTGSGHRDFEIVCDPALSLEEDAHRRDFTMNALYRDVVTGQVHDPLGRGHADLDAGLIQTTHPYSFRDDPLRILRALRFMSVLGFVLSESTYQQMCEHASHVTALTLRGVSGTTLEELSKLLMGVEPLNALVKMCDSGVFEVLLPELASMIGFDQRTVHHDKSLDLHTFQAIQVAADRDASLRVRLALLFHDAGKPWMAWRDVDGRAHYYPLTAAKARECGAPPTAVYSHEWWGAWLAERALIRLNAPADLRRDVITLVERHMLRLGGQVKPIKVRTWRSEMNDDLLSDLFEHRRCDVLGQGKDDVVGPLASLAQIEAAQALAVAEGVPRSTKELAIDGRALTALGLEGSAIGEVQRQLLHEVMAQPKLNDRAWLHRRAAELARQQ
jgi:tRNA nucleotidyltransferase (CCA-adding enzyme)